MKSYTETQTIDLQFDPFMGSRPTVEAAEPVADAANQPSQAAAGFIDSALLTQAALPGNRAATLDARAIYEEFLLTVQTDDEPVQPIQILSPQHMVLSPFSMSSDGEVQVFELPDVAESPSAMFSEGDTEDDMELEQEDSDDPEDRALSPAPWQECFDYGGSMPQSQSMDQAHQHQNTNLDPTGALMIPYCGGGMHLDNTVPQPETYQGVPAACVYPYPHQVPNCGGVEGLYSPYQAQAGAFHVQYEQHQLVRQPMVVLPVGDGFMEQQQQVQAVPMESPWMQVPMPYGEYTPSPSPNPSPVSRQPVPMVIQNFFHADTVNVTMASSQQ
ncbi:hypothetical protein N658DRAFT_489592 [Parathielavia hyrcaniae]|uniref:Uncharacterized protein n=1 Tax=Parathielavia hyrcaniae TaxID=113614 RepID=A0AAN6PUJ9_9PEZI|nr:hypothetical protein N658DRAFT_489592 [Parathielavia hyrcaniae]